MIRIGGQSKQYGVEIQEMINLKRFYFTFHSDQLMGPYL